MPDSAPQSSTPHHTFGRIVFWLIMLIVGLMIVIFLFGNETPPDDPAATFLSEHTRDSITEGEIQEAGAFLTESQEPIDDGEMLLIDNFLNNTSNNTDTTSSTADTS